MTVKHIYTCTQCTTEVTLEGDSFFGSGPVPNGWLTVNGMMPSVGTDTPAQYAKKQPHLCSWSCLAVYAKDVSESPYIRK